MDKVVGWALREGRLPLSGSILCVSGRLSFELVQKAAVAGCPVLVAVGRRRRSPSSSRRTAASRSAGSGATGALPSTGARADHHVTRLTGVLLVGGASRRFGSPKALARFRGETLAERGRRLLVEACDEVVIVGKAGDLPGLPFPVVDDGAADRAPVYGLLAGLRRARHESSSRSRSTTRS